MPRLEQPHLLLASDMPNRGNLLHRLMVEEGFAIDFAGDYRAAESLAKPGKYLCILLDISDQHAAESAVETALRIKQAVPQQCVGYLADPTVQIWGLVGDALLPRTGRALPEALRDFLATGLDGVVLAPRLAIRAA